MIGGEAVQGLSSIFEKFSADVRTFPITFLNEDTLTGPTVLLPVGVTLNQLKEQARKDNV